MKQTSGKQLDARDVARIYRLYGEGAEARLLAKGFGTTLANVTRIIRGQIWAEITGGANISRHDRLVRMRTAYIQARWDQGCRSQSLLAHELGISRQAVNKFMIRHSLGHHATKENA